MQTGHFITILSAAVVAAVASPAWGQEDDKAVTEAAEVLPEFMTPGPNVDRQKPPRPEPTLPLSEEPAEEAPGPNQGRVHLVLGFDWTNAYFYRGIRQEDEGFIVQPYAGVSFDAYQGQEWAFSVDLSTWSSFQDNDTGVADPGSGDLTDSWYESDLVIGGTLTHGNWSVAGTYSWFTSPSDAWDTMEQVDVTVDFDDSEAMGEWKLQPSATLTLETDNAIDGQDEGLGLQLGVTPGFEKSVAGIEGVTIEFPLTVALSLDDYFQDSTGEDEFFGSFTAGVRATVPLDVDAKLGSWSLTASANFLVLGDTAQEFNDDEDTDFVVSVGVGMEY